MYIIEEVAAPFAAPTRFEVPKRGLVFVGKRADRHAQMGAMIVDLEDDTVTSGKNGHCRIWEEAGRLYVEDQGSDNGTWLGTDADSRVREFEATEIGNGSVLRVGRHVLRVRLL